jgi:hypothetical protein
MRWFLARLGLHRVFDSVIRDHGDVIKALELIWKGFGFDVVLEHLVDRAKQIATDQGLPAVRRMMIIPERHFAKLVKHLSPEHQENAWNARDKFADAFVKLIASLIPGVPAEEEPPSS